MVGPPMQVAAPVRLLLTPAPPRRTIGGGYFITHVDFTAAKGSDEMVYSGRLIWSTLVLATWGGGGGIAVWFMWQYVANAYETWDYFPRGMFIIPGGITLLWVAGSVAVLWAWVNCLLNTKWAREGDVAEQGDSGSDTEAAERESGGYMGTPESPRLREARTGETAVEEARRYKLQRAVCPHCAGRRETLGWVFGIPVGEEEYVYSFVCEDHKGAWQALNYEGDPDPLGDPVEVKCVLCLTFRGTTHADPNKGSWWFLCNDCEPRARELIETAAAAQAEQEGNSGERSLALNFLRVLQWASARQQLTLEEWNDELAIEASDPIEGDEIFNPPIFEISEAQATRCLPVAERRLAIAVSIRDEFAKLRDFEMPEALVVAVDAWARAFEIHLERCEKTVRDLRALIAGDRSADNDEEQRLLSEESETMDEAIAADHTVMDQWRIDFAELQEMMFAACNDLRLERGKPKLSVDEFTELYSSAMAGQRSRFYA